MIIREYHQVSTYFAIGDEVWACAFHYSHNKESKSLHQKPVLGVLMAGDTLYSHNSKMERMRSYYDKEPNPGYFVPFKKNSKELAWSKSVMLSSRCYASTEEEAIQLYNDLITEAIDWHNSEIKDLQAKLIK